MERWFHHKSNPSVLSGSFVFVLLLYPGLSFTRKSVVFLVLCVGLIPNNKL